MDTDRNGKLTVDEIAAAELRHLSSREMAEAKRQLKLIVKKVDKDGDKLISMAEFPALMGNLVDMELEEEDEEALEFMRMDKDQDGMLNMEEISVLFSRAGEQKSEDVMANAIKTRFAQIDTDGDGFVSGDEFQVLLGGEEPDPSQEVDYDA